mgnify:CR=1 FL=1
MANIMSSQSLAEAALSRLAVSAKPSLMADLSRKYEHYRARLREAMAARKLTNEGMAEKVNSHPVTISKLRNGTMGIDDEWRTRFADAFAIPEPVLFGEGPLPEPRPFEIYVSPKKAAKQKKTRPANDNRTLPLYGLAAGSLAGQHAMTSDPVDQVPCPPALADVAGAYALRTRGESMVPRYMPGDVLYVNPHQRVRPGDHVIVQTMLHDNSGTETWVKRFEGENPETIEVWQYNPPAKVEFKRRFVMHVHRVLPVNELFGM